ncbi:hypothetical protein EVAR_29269_1 [Eumeta japonica]|uniref:Uncharacterized protein n=1 Tax=Eumeta variegata TaxID=151549 RepID=A0A4C1VTI5_EUMVA|nr:hypothetical protein EVAR_29269_1 [Eumeta japonica]
MLKGRPSTPTTEDDVSDLQLMIETDKRVTYQQIQTSFGIGPILPFTTPLPDPPHLIPSTSAHLSHYQRYPIPTQEAGNALLTLFGLQMFMGGAFGLNKFSPPRLLRGVGPAAPAAKRAHVTNSL